MPTKLTNENVLLAASIIAANEEDEFPHIKPHRWRNPATGQVELDRLGGPIPIVLALAQLIQKRFPPLVAALPTGAPAKPDAQIAALQAKIDAAIKALR